VSCVILVAPHDFKDTVSVIRDSVKAYELVGHRDGE
jgi:hypothetical protein